MSLKILIVGAGAVGGYFGARLAASGQGVSFLVRPARAKKLKALGLEVESPLGNLELAPDLVTADRLTESYDLIFLSVKGYGLDAATEDFAPAVGPDTLILPVLNGMRHMDRLEALFGRHRVLGGACRIVVQLKGNVIQQQTPLQTLIVGQLDGQVSSRLQPAVDAMRSAGFETTVSTHIVQDLWEKWVQLAAVGAATCLLGGPVGAIAEAPGGVETAHAILKEAADIAGAAGFPPSKALFESTAALLAQRGSAMTSSMYRDLIDGADVEVEAILQDLVDRGHRHGLAAPLLQAAATRLFVYRGLTLKSTERAQPSP